MISAEGMKNGLTRRGPFSCSSIAVSAMVARPPMPEPMITPVRSPLALVLGRPVRVLHRLVGGGHGVEDEIVDAPLLAGAHHLVGIERAVDIRPAAAAARHARHLAGDLAGVVAGVEGGDPASAGLAGQEGRPGLFRTPGQGRDHANSGDDDAAHCQGPSPSRFPSLADALRLVRPANGNVATPGRPVKIERRRNKSRRARPRQTRRGGHAAHRYARFRRRAAPG